MDVKESLELYRKKLKMLIELKEKEPDNNYHNWDIEIANTEHNISVCLEELS